MSRGRIDTGRTGRMESFNSVALSTFSSSEEEESSSGEYETETESEEDADAEAKKSDGDAYLKELTHHIKASKETFKMMNTKKDQLVDACANLETELVAEMDTAVGAAEASAASMANQLASQAAATNANTQGTAMATAEERAELDAELAKGKRRELVACVVQKLVVSSCRRKARRRSFDRSCTATTACSGKEGRPSCCTPPSATRSACASTASSPSGGPSTPCGSCSRVASPQTPRC